MNQELWRQTVDQKVTEAINDHIFPGCVIGWINVNGQREILPFGQLTYGEDSPRTTEHTLYDIASVTKSIPTSSLLLLAIDRKKLHLDDKVINFIPEIQNSYRAEIQVKHLLTYTLEFRETTPLSAMKDKSADEILNTIFTNDLKYKPGTTYKYSNAIGILMGQLAERIFQEPLDTCARKMLFTPLEMQRTTFHPLKYFTEKDMAPTEVDDWRQGEVRGRVHDESAFILQEKMIPGSAGLFTTAKDLLNFVSMLLAKGTYNTTVIYSPEIVEHMYENQLASINEQCGLGWALQRQYMGSNPPASRFGRNGFTGCMVVCDVKEGKGVVILSNQTYPKRKADKSAIDRFHADIADIIFNEEL